MNEKNNCIKLSKIFLMAIVLLFAIIIGKIVYISISPKVDGIDLKIFASSRTTVTKTLTAQRGTIYDNLGEVLAQNVNSYTVIAYLSSSRTTDESNPQHVVDKEATASALSPLLGMSEETILKLLNNDAYQVELGPGGRGISELLKQEIEALDLPGIDFIQSSKRYYPYEDFASYIVGYARTNSDTSEIEGEMGIESEYNKELSGTDGSITYVKDAYGYQIANTPETLVDAQDGYDIYLTIDHNIQMYLENAIDELGAAGDTWATITVAEAKTGAIVGSASNPSFNPNTLSDITNYNDPLTSYAYEPGSTMKIYSFMAAIEEGLYDGNATYSSGTINVDDYTIKDWNSTGWGTITFDKGFTYSSNVAAVNLAQKLGTDKLLEYYEKFGFGTATGIELPNEYSGKIDVTYASELASAAYGQGITTTPVQNIQALTSLANSGTILKPYIISKIVDSDTGKTVYEGKRTEIRQVVSESTVEKMIELMDETVNSEDTAVTGHKYQTDSVRLIGKTGTAQYIDDTGSYSSGSNTIRSFAGLFPKDDPEYIIYVSVKQFAGTSNQLGEIVKSLVESIATYKELDTDETSEDSTQLVNVTNYISSSTETTVNKLTIAGLTPIVLGSGSYIINQYPNKGMTVLKGSKVYLLTNNTDYTMPDVTGWTSSEIISLANMLGLAYTISGYGTVVSTSISAGTVIDLNSTLNIILSSEGG